MTMATLHPWTAPIWLPSLSGGHATVTGAPTGAASPAGAIGCIWMSGEVGDAVAMRERFAMVAATLWNKEGWL